MTAGEGRGRRAGQALALLVFLVGCLSSGLFLGLKDDEGVTVNIAVGHMDREVMQTYEPVPVTDLYATFDGHDELSPGEVLANLQLSWNPYPPAYFLLLNRWTALAGTERAALRLPSLLCGVLALLGLARIARRVIPFRGADTWIMLFAALSPWLWSMSTFARPYAMALALGAWSTVAALAVVDDSRRWRPRVAFALLSLLGLYTLYHYGFVLVWQACFLLLAAAAAPAGQRGRLIGAHAVMGAVIVAGFLPWLPFLRAHLELTGTVRSYYLAPALDDAGASLAHLLTSLLLGEVVRGGTRHLLNLGLGLLALATLPFLLVGLRRRDAGDAGAAGRILLLSAPLYPLSILGADLLHGVRTLMISKTSFLLFPLLLVLLLRGWLAPRKAAARAALLLVALGLMLPTAVLSVQATHERLGDDNRLVAEALSAADGDGHMVLVNTGVRSQAIPLLMALRDAGVRELRIVAAPPARLAEVLAKTLARDDAASITLVHLRTEFDPRKMWTADQLDAALDVARAAGWKVRRARPAGLSPQPAPTDGRLLEVIDPVL